MAYATTLVCYALIIVTLIALIQESWAGVDPAKQRCAFTRGTWCTNYAQQEVHGTGRRSLLPAPSALATSTPPAHEYR
mgnify:CR=1 FL=1